MLCHSVRSCHWPSLSLNRSLVAIENLATGIPPWVYFTSGSLPRFPIRITLLTLFPAMNALLPPLAETRARTTNQGLDAQFIRNNRPFDLKGAHSLAGRSEMATVRIASRIGDVRESRTIVLARFVTNAGFESTLLV